MANHVVEATVNIGIKDLEQLIRQAVREEMTEIVRKQPSVFYLEPKTPLYEDMKAIRRMKKSGKAKVYSRREAFSG